MTRQLTITAAEWASVQDGTLWLVARGNEHWLMAPDEPKLISATPPVEFVQACAPCETCGDQRIAASGGPGYFKDGRLHHLAGGQTIMEIRCPDCHIELVGPCPHEEWLGEPHQMCHRCGQFTDDWGWAGGVNQRTITFGHAYAVGEPLLLHDWPGVGISPGMLKALAHYGPPEEQIGKWAIELWVVGS